MAKTILDPKELIGFRLLSGEEISASDTVSAKLGSKAGTKEGGKATVGDDDGGWVPGISGGDDGWEVK